MLRHPAHAVAYAELKHALVYNHGVKRADYSDEKGPFIANILAAARHEISEANFHDADPISFASYNPDHLASLIPMWRMSFEKGVGIPALHPIEEQRQYFLNEVLSTNDVMVAHSQGNVIGFVAATDTHIAQLYVHPEYQRRGIGTKLLAWAMRRSAGRLSLVTFEQNLGAQRFYEHHGFKIIAQGFEAQWQLPDLTYEWVAPSSSQ